MQTAATLCHKKGNAFNRVNGKGLAVTAQRVTQEARNKRVVTGRFVFASPAAGIAQSLKPQEGGVAICALCLNQFGELSQLNKFYMQTAATLCLVTKVSCCYLAKTRSPQQQSFKGSH